MRCWSSSGIPGPVSEKAIRILSPSRLEAIRIVLRFESASASLAFVSRLMKTCSS
jgi:hypothetical protein